MGENGVLVFPDAAKGAASSIDPNLLLALQKHLSYILFNSHKSWLDYLNSLVHEAEHVKEAMLEAYDVENKGEPPAYTIGYLVMRM